MTVNKLHSWHSVQYAKLIQLRSQLPNAVLLCGDNRLDLNNLAINFIGGLFCSNPSPDKTYCGNCSACILLQHRSHPDLFYLAPEEDSTAKNITVNTVRRAIEFAYLTPHSANYRVIIIENVNLLNNSSANALLKILEEPPSYVLFILITDNLGKILPTIRSRCHKLMVKTTNYFADNNMLNDDFWPSFYDYLPLIDPPISDEELELLINTLTVPSIDNIFICVSVFDGKKISFSFILEFFYKWLTELGIIVQSGSLQRFIKYEDKIKPLLPKLDQPKLFYLFDELNFLSNWSTHPLNYKLQIEKILFDYQQLFS